MMSTENGGCVAEGGFEGGERGVEGMTAREEVGFCGHGEGFGVERRGADVHHVERRRGDEGGENYI